MTDAEVAYRDSCRLACYSLALQALARAWPGALAPGADVSWWAHLDALAGEFHQRIYGGPLPARGT